MLSSVELSVIGAVAAALFAAAVVAFITTPVVRSLAFKVGAVDVPRDNRRMHKHPIPRMGGLAIFFGFILSALIFIPLTTPLRGMLLGAVVIVILGIFDDIYALPAMPKFLIQILAAKGYEISGSDVLDGSIIRYEREMGVKVSLGHNADNVVGADMVVYSAAISKDNVELNAAASYGIPTVERSVLLGYVSRLYKQSICVSGTHGKTTTTSMITTALELAGRDPSAVIGGKLPLINGYGKAGKGDDIVIEACEFAETFLKLTPYLSVVLNIDNDHLDYYGSMGELKFAFKRFALMTQFMIFANADDKNTMDVMYTLDRRVRTFAIDNHADYRAVNVNEYKPGFFEFDLKEWNTTDTTRIRLSVPGRHNIYNALAMCAVCRFVGLSAEQCAEAALNFKGAGRRFEVYGECNGALVIDDYAHHPTELRATLNTAKEMGYKRLIAVHQPFTYSRTKMLFNDFVDVLKIPDITVLTPIMGSREPNDPTITSAKLAAQIPNSVLVDSLEAAADWVKQNAREGDLVITLGCGDIYKASKMMVKKD